MHPKLQGETEKALLSTGFEKKFPESQSKASFSVYFRDAPNVLRKQLSETFHE